MSTQFVELYGYESPTFEYFVDLVFEKSKTFSRCYLRKEKVNEEERNKMIRILTVNFGFIVDKELKDRLELIDSKTGRMRFYIWKNGLIEFHSKELI